MGTFLKRRVVEPIAIHRCQEEDLIERVYNRQRGVCAQPVC
jgi:hypothetical protein